MIEQYSEKRAQKDAKEEAALDKLEGLDASYAGCAQCQAAQKQSLNKNALFLGLGLGGAEILAQAITDKSIANQNARLGYPTGPNPYASAIGAGFPFLYGGIYGAMMGGQSYGGYGCSPTQAGGMMGGGPFYGGPYGGMGYPYGGGMYNPGYAPWGYAGPGMGMGGGMMSPMMPGGMGPFAGQGFPMGGYGGIGAGYGSPFGMGSPFGYGGPFMGGAGMGLGMGIGSPYGMASGYGSPYGMGAGGYGLGGYGYGQQMQSFDDMSRRMQLYTTTMQQSYQLQGLASQYGSGLGGYGGAYGGGYGLGGGYSGYGYAPYGYGAGGGFGISAGFGIGSFGTPGVSPYQFAQPTFPPQPYYNGR